jgi:hypothetical protein
MGNTISASNDYIQRRIWNFCIHPDILNQGEIYIDPNTLYQAFPKKSIGDFSFYVNKLPQMALTTEIELFSANLHIRLDVFNIDPKPETSASAARAAIRATMNIKANSVQDLIDTVLSNYQENS